MVTRCSKTFDPSLLDRPGAVFIDDRDRDSGDGRSWFLSGPVETIIALSGDEVPGALARLEECLRAGRFVAGYIAYEAGLSLDKPIRSRHAARSPVMWLGVYEDCMVLDADSVDLGKAGDAADIRNIRYGVDEKEYVECVERSKEYISDGDVYQINYTCKLYFENLGSARALFACLRTAHPVPHSAFVNTGSEQIISLSPELFLRREGCDVLTRPMKGTMKRGRWSDEDDAIASMLSTDEKNCAENVMIVDLMRNDLGRVCETGSVRVSRLFHVERYASLFQMTSDVVGRLGERVSMGDLLRATFPPGSVTGAPKIRTMEIIDELESEARGVYCGCVGLFRPDSGCVLNVAIRTIVQRGRECEMGIGSGIVADSDPREEWDETRLKGRFLTAAGPEFRLLETMLLRTGGGFVLLDEHLERMRRSAVYFGWDFPETEIRRALEKAAADAAGDTRVRLLLSEDGQFEIQRQDVGAPAEGPVRVMLASRRTDPANVFLYHKTTRREAYDADWREAQAEGYFDLIYQNINGEITEGAVTNIIVEIDGRWFTPPLSAGLLPGTWRETELKKGEVQECVLRLEDLVVASRVVMGNSVRGGVEVEAIEKAGAGGPLWLRPKTTAS